MNKRIKKKLAADLSKATTQELFDALCDKLSEQNDLLLTGFFDGVTHFRHAAFYNNQYGFQLVSTKKYDNWRSRKK